MVLLAAGAWGAQPPEGGAVTELTWACDGAGGAAKVMAACYRLGELYREGTGVERNQERATELYQQACPASAPDARACLRLGELLARGEGVPKDEVRALGLYRRGCDAGLAEACTALAPSQPRAPGSGSSLPKAGSAELMELATRSGDQCRLKKVGACRDLVRLYVERHHPAVLLVLNVAAPLLSDSCLRGSLPDCTLMGRTLLQLSEEPQRAQSKSESQERGRLALRLACNGGELAACTFLGLAYQDGSYGLAKDTARAREFLQGACLAGGLDACAQLAMLQLQGSQEAERGLRLLEGGCELDHGLSCARLAQLYQEGQGVPRDELRALGLSAKACRLGHTEACASVPVVKPPAPVVPKALRPDTHRRLEQSLVRLKPLYEELRQATEELTALQAKAEDLTARQAAQAQWLHEIRPQVQALDDKKAALQREMELFAQSHSSPTAEDEATSERFEQQAKLLEEERARLMRETVTKQLQDEAVSLQEKLNAGEGRLLRAQAAMKQLLKL